MITIIYTSRYHVSFSKDTYNFHLLRKVGSANLAKTEKGRESARCIFDISNIVKRSALKFKNFKLVLPLYVFQFLTNIF